MKGLKLKKALTIFIVLSLVALAGCRKAIEEEEKEEKELFSVDFSENQTLRYTFISSREIETRWLSGSSEEKGNVDKVIIDRSGRGGV